MIAWVAGMVATDEINPVKMIKVLLSRAKESWQMFKLVLRYKNVPGMKELSKQYVHTSSRKKKQEIAKEIGQTLKVNVKPEDKNTFLKLVRKIGYKELNKK